MATRADVARLAGVSASTVSYALSGERPVKPETRARILAAVAELNYVPHFAAGALAGKRSKAIALLFAGSELAISPVALEYVTGAANAARARGYHLILWPSDETALADVKRFSLSGLLAGVLLMEIRLEDQRVEALQELNIPITLIGRTKNTGEIPFVDRDFSAVAKAATSYLADLGHKKIGLLTQRRGKDELVLGVDSRFKSEVLTAAKSESFEICELSVENSAQAGREACAALHENHPDATALVALPDLATMGFLSAAQELGIRIPHDFSVLALNTPDNQVGLTWPPLCTVTIPANEMGRAAADILIDQLEAEQTQSRIQQLWAGELSIRGTTAKSPRL